MSNTTTKKPQAAKPTKPGPKPAPAKGTTKGTAKPKASSATPTPAPKPKVKAPKPEPKSLVEALATGQCVLIKVRANGTKRSLPYWPESSDQRVLAHAAATMKADGKTVEAIAKEMKVSLATARRFLTGLALAQDVEAGKVDKAWKPRTTEVVVHTVTAKA